MIYYGVSARNRNRNRWNNMQIWIDVEDASGTRYGQPITTATNWTNTRRLDRAGEFSFTMPASDPKLVCSDLTNLLQHKRVVRCWGADGHSIQELGAGIIDLIEWDLDAAGATVLTVSGSDLLRELANRTVGDLELFEEVAYPHPATRIIVENDGQGYRTLPAVIELDTSPLFLYIRYTQPFSKITLTLDQYNTVATDSLSVQYYMTTGGTKWVEVSGLVNGTISGGKPFAQSGTITFDPPQGWASESLGLYSIRISDQQQKLSSFRITAISVSIVQPVADGLQRIMALAPEGWSLDPAGMYATWNTTTNAAKSVYMQFSGESVLAALVLLAEQTGEHFTLSAAARRVWWIGEAKEASGIRAVQSRDDTLRAFAADAASNATMLITGLSQASDSYELYTRCYSFGAGVGSGRLTMEKATRVTSGYTLGPLGAYLQADAATATYGRIDKREDFPDIAPDDASAQQIINAANTLYDRVYEALRRKSQLQYAYSLEVVPSRYTVWPGQTITVDYHEWADSFHVVNISNLLLWVLETAQTIDASGIQTVAMTVATVDYWPTNDYRTVAKLIGVVQTDRSVEIPEQGYTSVGSGTPSYIAVQNGMITSIGRTKTIDDGPYPPVGEDIDQIVFKNGLAVTITFK